MVTRLVFVTAVVLSLGESTSALSPHVKEVPGDFGFWNPGAAVNTLCPRDKAINWDWPSLAEINAKAPQDVRAAEGAKEEAEDWLRLLTNGSLIPHDIQQRMVPLDEDVDRVVARYVVDDLAIYWLQTKRSLHILVRKVSGERAADLPSMCKLVQEVAQKLFVGPDGPVPSVSVPEEFARQTDFGGRVLVATGNVTFYRRDDGRGAIYNHPDKSLMVPFWWGLRVNTDGETVHFENILKLLELSSMTGGGQAMVRMRPPGEPIIESWFSAEPEPRTIPARGTTGPGGQ